jgi:hypothetical protein
MTKGEGEEEGGKEGGRAEELVCVLLCLFALYNCLQKLRYFLSYSSQSVLVMVSLPLLSR